MGEGAPLYLPPLVFPPDAVPARAETPFSAMANFQIKAGGPTRGRRRVKKIGMGSGKAVSQAKKTQKKGKRS